MSRLTFPNERISPAEMARSIRIEQGRPEPPAPDELHDFEIDVEETTHHVARATDEDDAERRYWEGRGSVVDVVERYVGRARRVNS